MRVAVPGIAVLLLSTTPVVAGMPTITLTDIAKVRLETVSFFAVLVLCSAIGVRDLWNRLRRDFTALPPLSFRGALVGVLLWGMLFVIVLTMISGARELMTPGAWEKHGLTYQLRVPESSPPESPSPSLVGSMLREQRIMALQALAAELLSHAQHHDGRLPAAKDARTIPAAVWTLPERPGVEYRYIEGRQTGAEPVLVAYEPAVYDDEQYALLSDGSIRQCSAYEIGRLRNGDTAP